MYRFHSYIQEALRLVEHYACNEPFSVYLKKQFSLDKRKGSRDRKQITDISYRFFRIGNSFPEHPREERMWIALLLTATDPDEIIQALKPEWAEYCSSAIHEKLKLIGKSIADLNCFPLDEYLSREIDQPEFQLRFLKQPDVFLRVRPGNETAVHSVLQKAAVGFRQLTPDCLLFKQGIQLDNLLQMNQQVVVQDINSQKVVPLLLNVFSMSDTFSVWDCCAASGGKAIQLHDLFPDSKLLVSDIRSSILNNLQERFRQAGIHTYTAQLLDLSKAVSMDDQFDVIIADVPCSGSGTWSRTPEQLRCFSANQIKDYVVLQQKILTNVLPSLKAGGYLLYSTCSVFRDENESQIKWLEEKFQLKTIDSGLLLEKKLSSDILYAALLQKI